jgi:hypothetical protein
MAKVKNRSGLSSARKRSSAKGARLKEDASRPQNERTRRYSHIVARAWSDESFKKRLLSNPMDVFSEYKLDYPVGVQIRVVENTEAIIHFVLPAKPSSIEHMALDRLPALVLDSPCHGHESSSNCASHLCGHHTQRCA